MAISLSDSDEDEKEKDTYENRQRLLHKVPEKVQKRMLERKYATHASARSHEDEGDLPQQVPPLNMSRCRAWLPTLSFSWKPP